MWLEKCLLWSRLPTFQGARQVTSTNSTRPWHGATQHCATKKPLATSSFVGPSLTQRWILNPLTKLRACRPHITPAHTQPATVTLMNTYLEFWIFHTRKIVFKLKRRGKSFVRRALSTDTVATHRHCLAQSCQTHQWTPQVAQLEYYTAQGSCPRLFK